MTDTKAYSSVKNEYTKKAHVVKKYFDNFFNQKNNSFIDDLTANSTKTELKSEDEKKKYLTTVDLTTLKKSTTEHLTEMLKKRKQATDEKKELSTNLTDLKRLASRNNKRFTKNFFTLVSMTLHEITKEHLVAIFEDLIKSNSTKSLTVDHFLRTTSPYQQYFKSVSKSFRDALEGTFVYTKKVKLTKEEREAKKGLPKTTNNNGFNGPFVSLIIHLKTINEDYSAFKISGEVRELYNALVLDLLHEFALRTKYLVDTLAVSSAIKTNLYKIILTLSIPAPESTRNNIIELFNTGYPDKLPKKKTVVPSATMTKMREAKIKKTQLNGHQNGTPCTTTTTTTTTKSRTKKPITA